MRFLLALAGVILMATSVLNLKENKMAWHTELDDPIEAAVEVGINTGTPITEATLPPAVDVGNDTVALVGNTYRRGDRDAGPDGDIRSAQTNMIRMGIEGVGEVDGVYGRNTENGVQNSQEMFGLPRTGVLDQATQDAFNNLTDDQIAFFTSETEAVAPAEVEETPAPVVETPTTEAPTVYTIQAGDNFSKIASENTFTLDQLIAANPNITDPSNIQIGQEINLPTAGQGNVANDPTMPNTLQAVTEVLPTEIAETVETAGAETPEEINNAIFDGATFSGALPTPSVGDDPITWIVENVFGVREENPEFRRALKGIFQGLDPDKQPWCAALVGHILRNIDVDLPLRAQQNPNLAFNYQDLGEEVYSHNPTTGTTYAGSLGDVQVGDIVVFNKSANRQSDGSFSFAKGHISFVVGTRDDGTILALGGNQSDRVQVSEYTPDVIRRFYPGGFRVRRITTEALEQTSPEVIAAITSDIATGGAGE